MRVAFVTDLHISEDRLALHRELLAKTAEAIRALEPDVVLIGGDLAGRTVPHLATPGERNALVEFIGDLGRSPTIVCRGNHDSPGDWLFLDALPGVYYAERPTLVTCVTGPAGKCSEVAVLPWHETWDEAYLAEADEAFGDPLHPRVCLTHATFEGARLRLGQPEVPTRDVSIRAEDLCERFRFEFIFSGHYHAAQAIGSGHGIYGGSLFYNEFGEAGPKGFCFVEFNEDGPNFAGVHHPIEQPKRYRAARVATGGYEVTPGGERTYTIAELARLDGPVKVVESCPKEKLAARRALLAGARLPEGSRIHLTPSGAVRAREGAESVLAAPDFSTKFRRWAERSDAAPETVARAGDLLPAITHES